MSEVDEEVREAEEAALPILKRDVDEAYLAAARLVKSCTAGAGGVGDIISCIDGEADDAAVRDAARKIFLNTINSATGRNMSWQELIQAVENGGLGDLLVEAGSG